MENQKPNTTETSKQHESFCLSCILEIAAAASTEITKATQAAYLKRLRELPRESMQQATDRTVAEWDKPHMMPPLKFILDRSHGNAQLQAEAAWETVQRLVFKVWHPDVGWPGGAKPDIEPAIEYAIRQVGGMRKIHDVEMDAVQFVRRDFIEAFTRFTTEGGAQVALSEKQAAGILGDIQKSLTAQREQKALPAPQNSHQNETTPPVRRRVAPEQSREEYDARMAELRRQAERLKTPEGITQ